MSRSTQRTRFCEGASYTEALSNNRLERTAPARWSAAAQPGVLRTLDRGREGVEVTEKALPFA
jgi:hypothetical protein